MIYIGTRLGVNYPKGMYEIEIFKNVKKSIFQMQIERMLKLINMANLKFNTLKSFITCFVMTSDSTKSMTIEYFEKNNYFGFNKNDMVFFEQDVLPCVDIETKKILLSEKNRIAFAPNGNGGFFDSLVREEKLMKLIKERKIKGLHVYCVDNVLVRSPDPIFIGCCNMKNVDCGNKVK